MLKLLIETELRRILATPRFLTVVGLVAGTLLISVYVGTIEYHRSVETTQTRDASVMQLNEQWDHWGNASAPASRRTDPLMVFSSGLWFDVSHHAVAHQSGAVIRRITVFSEDTLFAFFRFADATFIFQFVLTLLAVLLTHDAISGERTAGTLRLVLSNRVARVQIVLAKFVSSWLVLSVPIIVVLLTSLLIAMLSGVPFESRDLMRFASFCVVSGLVVTCFLAIGMLGSTLTQTPSESFLVLLVAWTFLTLIIPPLSSRVASTIVPAATISEIESQYIGFFRTQITKEVDWYDAQNKRYQEDTKGMTNAERNAYFKSNSAKMLEEQENFRHEMSKTLTRYRRQLIQARRAQVRQRERLAFGISRLSPAATYRLAAQRIANTGISSTYVFEDDVDKYGRTISAFIIGQSMDHVMTADREPIDASLIPLFERREPSLQDTIGSAMLDFGLIIFYTILSLGCAFIAFLRYDVR